jgi:hypothetical protein
MKKFKLLLVLTLLLAAPAYAEGVVLVNKAVGIDTIKVKMLKNIFKGRVTLWDNGTAVSPCYLAADNPEMDHFYKAIVKKSRDGFDRYWIKKLFAGAGVNPKVLDNSAAIVALLSVTNGGVCYLDKAPDSLPANVKVINVL